MTELVAVLDRLRADLAQRFGLPGAQGPQRSDDPTPEQVLAFAMYAPNLRWHLFKGLNEAQITQAEAEAERPLPWHYADFLRLANGGQMLGVSFNGLRGDVIDRSMDGPGQPVSLCYHNAPWSRHDGLVEDCFVFGAINGEGDAQGLLCLRPDGVVTLNLRGDGREGARWPSLAAFLDDEVRRRFDIFDGQGKVLPVCCLLPANTADWEAIATKQAQAEADARRPLARVWRWLSGT